MGKILTLGQCNDNLYQLLRIASGAEVERSCSHPDVVVFHPSGQEELPSVDCPLLAIGWGMHALLHTSMGRKAELCTSVEHQEEGLFAHIASPMHVGCDPIPTPTQVPDDYLAIARSSHGVLAVQHKSLPRVGLLFRPESLLTDAGIAILENFLRHSL